MRVAREDAHVDAELSDQHLGAEAGDAGDRLEQLAFARERGDHLLDPRAEGGDRLVQVVDVGEDLRDEQGPWWSLRKRPASASLSAGSLRRRRPRASSASSSGSCVPATSASSISRTETPSVLEATLESLIPASCMTLSRRCTSRLRSSICALR